MSKLKLDWDKWLYGLGSAVIGGGSGAVVGGVTTALVFKVDVATWEGAIKVLMVMGIQFIVAGAFSMFFFLKQSPLPPVETSETVFSQRLTNADGSVTQTDAKSTTTETKP